MARNRTRDRRRPAENSRASRVDNVWVLRSAETFIGDTVQVECVVGASVAGELVLNPMDFEALGYTAGTQLATAGFYLSNGDVVVPSTSVTLLIGSFLLVSFGGTAVNSRDVVAMAAFDPRLEIGGSIRNGTSVQTLP